MNQSSSHFSSNPSLQISSMSVSSPLSVASIPSFDNNGLDPAQASLNRLQQVIGVLDNSLRLPSTPRAFMIYLVGLIIVFAGAFMHVLIAAQIMQAEFTLSRLQEEYRAIEQQNGDIIFQIARDSNLARLEERVRALGYVDVQAREYAFVPAETLANAGVVAANHAKARAATSATDAASTTIPAVDSGAAIHTTSMASSAWGGQFARWEEFWNLTWRAASGGESSTPDTPATEMESGSAQISKAVPQFWSTWWEQTTAQGSKLLDRFRGN